MAKQIKNAKSIQKKSRTNDVQSVGNGQYKVTSGSSGKSYSVKISEHGATCTCKWAQYRPAMDKRSGCSHVVAAYSHKNQEERGRNAYTWTSEDDVKRQKRQNLDIGDGVMVTL